MYCQLNFFSKLLYLNKQIRKFYGMGSFYDFLQEHPELYKFDDQVQECDYLTLKPEDFIKDFVNKQRPCLFKGYAKIWPAYEKCYLKEVAGEEVIYAERQKDNRFAYFTQGARRVYMTYREFLDKFSIPNRTEHFYYSFEDPPGPLKDDIIDIPIVEDYLNLTQITFWHGFGTLTRPHTDAMENIICVFEGYKNFTIVPDEHSPYVYAGFKGLPINYSPLEFVDPDYEQFPLFRKAKLMSAFVDQGDCLYMPSYWWHQVESSKGVTLALSHWYNPQHLVTDITTFAMVNKYSKNESPIAKQQNFQKQQQNFTNQSQKVDSTPKQQQQPDITSNISDLIAKTIQDQVTQGFKQMMEQVQKLTSVQSQQQVNTPSPTYGRVSKKDSSHTRSFASSIYEDDWRAQVQLKHISGGAASSKKISMDKPQSKEQSNRPSIMKNQQQYQSVRERPQREETEVDDDEDYVNDPEVDRQLQSRSPNNNLRSLFNDNRRQSITKKARKVVQEGLEINYSDPQLIKPQIKNARSETRNHDVLQEQRTFQPIRSNQQFYQSNIQGGNKSSTNLQYSPISQHRQQQDYSPLDLSHALSQHPYNSQIPMQQQQYMQNLPQYGYPQQQMNLPYLSQYQHMFQYDQNGQVINQPQLSNPYLNMNQYQQNQLQQQRQLMDQELFNFDEPIQEYTPTTHTYANTNNQLFFMNDMSQILNSETIDQQNQFAIILEDTPCQLKGDLMQLYEGDKVEVLKIIQDMGMAECKFHNQIGIFPLTCLKLIKRSVAQSSNQNLGMQTPILSQKDGSSLVPQRQLSRDLLARKSNISAISNTQQQQSPDEEVLSQIFNTRQNFFKQKLNDYEDINLLQQQQQQRNLPNTQQKQKQSSSGLRIQSNQSSQNQSNAINHTKVSSSGNNLKMNERRLQKQQKQDKESSEMY